MSVEVVGEREGAAPLNGVPLYGSGSREISGPAESTFGLSDAYKIRDGASVVVAAPMIISGSIEHSMKGGKWYDNPFKEKKKIRSPKAKRALVANEDEVEKAFLLHCIVDCLVDKPDLKEAS